jgi:hypothetical protein
MPPLRHRLLNLQTALALLLCVAAVCLAVRSYWRVDMWYRRGDANEYSACSGRGVILLSAGPIYRGAGARMMHPPGGFRSEPVPRGYRSAAEIAKYRLPWPPGFAVDPDHVVTGPTVYRTGNRLYLPHWFVALVFALPPLSRLRTWTGRRLRLKRRQCPPAATTSPATSAAFAPSAAGRPEGTRRDC